MEVCISIMYSPFFQKGSLFPLQKETEKRLVTALFAAAAPLYK